MTTRHALVLVVLPLLALVSGCGRTLDADPPRFAILDGDGYPVLTDEQISGYDWSTHSINLKPGAALDVRVKKGESIVLGIPFSVAADGVTCYRGVFTSSISSLSQSVPVINVRPLDATEGVVRIELGYPSSGFFRGDDPRGDERIRKALRSAGKLRE